MLGPAVVDGLRERWPRDDLEYLRLVATTLLALLILPLAIYKLVVNPVGAANAALGGAVRT